jgi:hypothetical protein
VQTGELTFSNKSEVNLIAGRSEYWHSPREIIDPTTLEMGFYRHEVTAADELRRYIYNWRLVGSGYSEIYHLPLGGALVLSMLVGTIVLLRQQKWRLLWGLACQGGYVSVLAIYAVIPWYLHATLPALSVLAAYGLRAVFYKFCSQQCHVTWRIAAALLLIGVTIALIEGGTRHPRWTLTSAPPTVSLLKEAGERLESMEPSGGVVYEVGATIGYYGGRIRRRLTPNDLDTILRYIDTHEAGWPVVWLALSSLQVDAYHPSVRRLLEVDVPHLQRVFQYEDRRGKVVILRVH